MRYLIFDIETIPLPDLGQVQLAEVERRTKRELEWGRSTDPEAAESLVRSVSPFLGQVLAVGMRLYSDDSGDIKDKVICESGEKETLEAFLETINHPASGDLRFVHYNGLDFDTPFIIVRAAHHGLKITNRRFLNLRKFYYDNHIDVMQFLSAWGRHPVSLELACASFGLPSPKEGEVTGESVAAAYEAGELDKVAEYVLRDVEATYQLFLKIKPYLPH